MQEVVKYEIVKGSAIARKVHALIDHACGNEKNYFGFDAEWDTINNPYTARTTKNGKIPLVQIGYRDRCEGFTRALLIQLNQKDERLPTVLQSFLND
jgi:hypothetical protein